MKRLLLAIPWTWLGFWGCSGPDSDLPPAYRKAAVPVERLTSEAARQRGRQLFLDHCALCHGESADGRGARHEGLATSPRDFTDRTWRRGTTPRRVYFAIREGVAGTGMPSWKSLPEEDAWDLTAYLLSVSKTGNPLQGCDDAQDLAAGIPEVTVEKDQGRVLAEDPPSLTVRRGSARRSG